jgi:hypothetical protein
MSKKVETTAKDRRQKFLADHGDKVMTKFRELGSALKVEKALKLSPFLVEYVLYVKGGIGKRKDIVQAAKEDGKKAMPKSIGKKVLSDGSVLEAVNGHAVKEMSKGRKKR